MDILRRALPSTEPVEPLGRECALIFLNVARDPTILVDNEASSRRPNGFLPDLSGLLNDKSSLVIALADRSMSGGYIIRKKNTMFLVCQILERVASVAMRNGINTLL